MGTAASLLSGFTAFMQMQGLSADTVRRRRVSISSFATFISPVLLEDATDDLVGEWLSSIRAPATRRAYRSDLHTLYRWAARRGLVQTNPVDETLRIRAPRGLPRPVDASLIDELLLAAPDRNTELIIALAAYAGLRRAEIAALDREDLNLHGRPPVLVVRGGKGGKDRAVPVHVALVRILEGCPAGPIVPLTKQSIGKKAAMLMRSHGVDATLHQLRHTFGTEAARASNGNLLVVKDLMGHESTQTTARYTALVATMTADTVGSMYASAVS